MFSIFFCVFIGFVYFFGFSLFEKEYKNCDMGYIKGICLNNRTAASLKTFPRLRGVGKEYSDSTNYAMQAKKRKNKNPPIHP